MTESARDEALRLAREAFSVVYRGPLGSPELAFTIEGAERLIALARQRPGWTLEALTLLKEVAFNDRDEDYMGEAWHKRYLAMLAAAPKPGEGT
jgi:hypothetical protein